MVGLYQSPAAVTRAVFPDAVLDLESDRRFINWDGPPREEPRGVRRPDGVGLLIEWFRSRYIFLPASPTPFFPAERRLIEIIVKSSTRFRGMFDSDVAHRLRCSSSPWKIDHHRISRPSRPVRIPAVLETLRVAALSTYENRRVSMGASCSARPTTPLCPAGSTPGGAPIRCPPHRDQGVPPALRRGPDGLRRRSPGRPVRAVDMRDGPIVSMAVGRSSSPCPRHYIDARATQTAATSAWS